MKIAIVTGASGNLGHAVVKRFIAAGYYVIGTIIPGETVSIELNGKNFETAVVDLLNEDQARQFVELVIIKHKRIDAAILTVGGFAMGDIDHTKTADIQQQVKLNFETTYNVARPVFIQMMEQKQGRIFLIGSRPGSDMRRSRGMVAYGLAKSMLFRLAELMNEEARDTNVVTAVLVPSTIDTPQNRKSMPGADPAKWVSTEAIAETICFYCSKEGELLREPIIKAYGYS